MLQNYFSQGFVLEK